MDNNDPCAPDAARPGSAEDEPPQPASSDAEQSGSSIDLDINDTTGRLHATALSWLSEFGALAVGRAVGGGAGAHVVALSVVDDSTMAGLHFSHSGIEGATDVLTFDLRDDPTGALDVEIVVCLDEARRQASDRCVERELLLYLLHGVLHCIGFDDHDPGDFDLMHAREDEILRAIGVGSVFGDGEDDR